MQLWDARWNYHEESPTPVEYKKDDVEEDGLWAQLYKWSSFGVEHNFDVECDLVQGNLFALYDEDYFLLLEVFSLDN